MNSYVTGITIKQLLNIRNGTMWNNYLVDGLSSNLFVKWKIRKVMKNIEKAHKAIEKMRLEA